MSKAPRVYLSSPHLGTQEFEFVREAFATNWIAPLGPHVDAFEKEFGQILQEGTESTERKNSVSSVSSCANSRMHCAALSSGTAALHLALKLVGLQRGEEVFCSSLTFSASANPIAYEGGKPVFIDSERVSWNMDPLRLEEALADRAAKGRLPRAVIVVHLYGQCADLDPIMAVCNRYGVAVIEDAAEALGAIYFSSKTISQEGTEKTENQDSVSSVSSWAKKEIRPGTVISGGGRASGAGSSSRGREALECFLCPRSGRIPCPNIKPKPATRSTNRNS